MIQDSLLFHFADSASSPIASPTSSPTRAARQSGCRVEALLGGLARGLTLGTFHAVCARILRVDGEAIGVPRGFALYDDADQMALMKRVCAEHSPEPRQYPPRAPPSPLSR